MAWHKNHDRETIPTRTACLAYRDGAAVILARHVDYGPRYTPALLSKVKRRIKIPSGKTGNRPRGKPLPVQCQIR